MSNDPGHEEGQTLIAELRLVKYMSDDGLINCVDLSTDNAGGDLPEEERNDLIMYALGKTVMPYVISWIDATYGKKLSE